MFHKNHRRIQIAQKLLIYARFDIFYQQWRELILTFLNVIKYVLLYRLILLDAK